MATPPTAETILEGIRSRAPAEVAGKQMFGSEALTVAGKAFLVASKGRIVLKLPRERVDALVAAGAARFDPGHGRPMKEWVALDPAAGHDWDELAAAARAFVAGAARGRG
jgi:TfoX/Sxy family transcriptional regulator of competence genes